MKLAMVIAAGLLIFSSLTAQTYTSITHNLPQTAYTAADWGDFDNDGDFDLAFSGSLGAEVCDVYRNDAGTFVAINAGLVPFRSGGIEWGDYDNDGDLDLIAVGLNDFGHISRLYRNDSLAFVHIDFGGPNIYSGTARWCDIDSDGDLDISVLGGTLDGFVTTVFRNDGNDQFSELSLGIPQSDRGSLDWGDFDEDGDEDLLLTGRRESNFKPRANIFRNDGDTLVPIATNFIHVFDGQACWYDYDQDGDLDALVAGSDSTSGFPFTDIYRNDAGTFVNINAVIAGCGEGGSVDIGDCDNDGDLDIAQLGVFGPGSDIFRYDGDSLFTRLMLTTQVSCCGTVKLGDYDADGDLDFLVSGLSNRTRLYQCSAVTANSQPSAPTGLGVVAYEDSVTLSWLPGNDDETSSSGLSYNVRVGTTPGGVELVSPMSDPASGLRRVVGYGNAYTRLNYKLRNLPPGIYYWSVQTIDNGWKGSVFAVEQSFSIPAGEFLCGDADSDGIVNISDAVYLISYIFAGGPAPNPLLAADADCSGTVNISDAVHLISYIFSGGPAPCSACL